MNETLVIKLKIFMFTFFCLLLSVGSAFASGITLPVWVSDNMMLPAGTPCKIKGISESGKNISVSFNEFNTTTKAGDQGEWVIELPPFPAGMKGELIFSGGTDKKVISNVVAGDIWLCSGQSNMVRTVALSEEAIEATDDIQTFEIRYFNGVSWRKVTKENVQNMSAVAIYFAMEMAQLQHTPVGILLAARGGTSIDAWVPENAFPDTESGKKMRLLVNDPEVHKAAEEDRLDFRPAGQHRLGRWGLSRAVPASLYEQLIKPYGNLPVRGVLWYQGESDAGTLKQAGEYNLWLENLISTYRSNWKDQDLPFVVIQLPDFDPGTRQKRKAWAKVQRAQKKVARKTNHAAWVDIKDLGDLEDIHPARKKEVGIRSAIVANDLIQINK